MLAQKRFAIQAFTCTASSLFFYHLDAVNERPGDREGLQETFERRVCLPISLLASACVCVSCTFVLLLLTRRRPAPNKSLYLSV